MYSPKIYILFKITANLTQPESSGIDAKPDRSAISS